KKNLSPGLPEKGERKYKVVILQYLSVSENPVRHLHLADAFIHRDLHMCDLQCIHTLHFDAAGTLHIRSTQGFSVLLKDAPTGNRTSTLLITNRLLYLLCHCRTQHTHTHTHTHTRIHTCTHTHT